MRIKNEKEEEKEIRRLKEILFPKNKNTYKTAVNSLNSNNLFDNQTRRQSTLNSKIHKINTQSDHINERCQKKSTNISHLDMLYDSEDGVKEMDCYEIGQNISSQYEEEKPQILIKDEINKLRYEINTMLEKWTDDDEDRPNEDPKEYERKIRQEIPIYEAINQELQESSGRSERELYTRRHYLENIQKISENLQKYNSYMYGIREAAEQVISVIPVDKNEHTFPNPHVRAYKLYYLGMMLTNYFVAKIQQVRNKRIRWAFSMMQKASEDQKTEKQKEKKKKEMNKGDFLFLRRNLLDKAFKKWRLNSELMKFKEILNPSIQASLLPNHQSKNLQQSVIQEFYNEKSSNTSQTNQQNKNGQFLASEFLVKNILHKEKIVKFLEEYLLNAIKVSSSRLLDKNIQNQINHDVEIVLFDQENNEMFSFVDQNDYLYQQMEGNIVKSRLYNVLDTIRDNSSPEETSNQNDHTNKIFKKYSFQLKNSLTRMCIDCEKTIRIPEMKRNEVYSLEVDSSINQQIWIKTSKTQRSSRVTQLSNKKQPFMTEEVFYQQKSMIDNHFHLFDSQDIKISAIFYPIIHEQALIGLVRQYIYHSAPISLPSFQLSYDYLEFATKSIFTTFELSYSFEGLRKEHEIVDRKYALKVLRMIRKIQEEIYEINKQEQSANYTQTELTNKLMDIFAHQLNKFLKVESKNDIKIGKLSGSKDEKIDFCVYKLEDSKKDIRELGKNGEKIIFYESKNNQKPKFNKLYGSKTLNFEVVDEILGQFYTQSKHKPSNISVVSENLNVLTQTLPQSGSILSSTKNHDLQTDHKILLIKSRSQIYPQPLYYIMIFHTKKPDSTKSLHKTLQKSSSSTNQTFLQQLPPVDLLMDMMNKLSQLYFKGLNEIQQQKIQTQKRKENQMIENKNKFQRRMREFYAQQLKLYVYGLEVEKRQKVKNGKSYMNHVNHFINVCLEKIITEVKYLKLQADLQQKDKIFCEVVYLAEIRLPEVFDRQNTLSIRSGIKSGSEKIYVLISIKIVKEVFEENVVQSEENKMGNKLQNINFQYLNQKEYTKLMSSNKFDNRDNQKILTFKSLNLVQLSFQVLSSKVLIESQSETAEMRSRLSNQAIIQSNQTKLTKQEIQQTLSDLIESFISFSYGELIKDEQKKATKNIQKQKNAEISSESVKEQKIAIEEQHKKYWLQIEGFKENIKRKVFQILCKKTQNDGDCIGKHKNNLIKPNINDSLPKLHGIINQIVRSIFQRYTKVEDLIDIQIHQATLEYILDQMLSFKNQVTNSVELKSSYHPAVPFGLMQLYYELLKLVQCQKTQEYLNSMNSSESREDNKNLDIFKKIMEKSQSLTCHFNSLAQMNLIQLIPDKNLTTQSQNSVKFTNQSLEKLRKIINSSYFTLNFSPAPNQQERPNKKLITVKIIKSGLQIIDQENVSKRNQIIQANFLQLQKSLEDIVKLTLTEYVSVFKWNYQLFKNQNIIQAVHLLVHGKSSQNHLTQTQNQISSNEFNAKMTIINSFKTQGLLMYNLLHSFKKIKLFSQSLVHNGLKLIKISNMMSNRDKQLTLKHLKKWQQTKNEIKHEQLMKILKEKIVSNPEKQSQKIEKLISVIGKNVIYHKILWYAFKKISFFAKHNRISNFKEYRLKYLNTALQHLNQNFNIRDNQQMKKFFNRCKEIGHQKRREQLLRNQHMKLFILKLEFSSFYRRKIAANVKQTFNLIKKMTCKQGEAKLNVIESILAMQRHVSLDEKITQSKSIQQVSEIISKEFSMYDIWVRPLKKYNDYILLSQSQSQLSNEEELISARNLSFDDSSIMASRINSITNRSKIQSDTKLSKEDIYLKYSPDMYSFLETSQTIFVSRNTFTVTDLLSSGPLQLGQTINSSVSGCSFKQKDKLHSLGKSLTQFFSNHKIQFNIKITYLDAIYSTMKIKRFSYAIKKWRKYNDNLRLLATCELTDKIYQLNIETESVKEKLKMQEKEIHDQRSEYNRLLKKETEHKNRIEKYVANIEILNKMLEHYQAAKKQQEEQIMRSAAKSSRKFSKNINYEPLIDFNSLDEEERNIVALTLIKWRQVNQKDKLKEMRARNLEKQTRFLTSCMARAWKTMSRTVILDSFQKILSFSLWVEELRQHKEREERLRLERIRKEEEERLERQRIERQSFERKRREIEELRKQIEQRKIKEAKQSKWKNQTTQISASKKNQTPNKIELNHKLESSQSVVPINEVSKISSSEYQESQTSYYNDYHLESVQKRSITHSLAEQLEGEFNELNRRLITFQKNHGSPSASQNSQISVDQYFNSYEMSESSAREASELEFKEQEKDLREDKGLEECNRAPNNTVDLTTVNQGKMTEEEKIRFELEKMKMRKPEFNKENLTVTNQEYERVNGGASYKLGGKTLRFLKRMGKLQGPEKGV